MLVVAALPLAGATALIGIPLFFDVGVLCATWSSSRPRGMRGGMARLGLGLAAIGRPAYLTPGRDADLPADRSRSGLRSRAYELLDAAYALGIRYFDAARSYGEAEQFLGSWLAERGIDDAFVASKWGYTYVGGWRLDAEQHEVKTHDLGTFDRQLGESVALLDGRLRLYQVHSVTPDSPVLTDRTLLDRLAALRESGIEVGASTSGPDQSAAVERLLAVEVRGRALFTSVQATWNLLETSAGPALTAAHARGLRVVVKEAVANGRLTAASPDVDPLLGRAAARHGVGVDAVAIAAALAQPWCDVVLSGAVTTGQLASNAAAAAVALPPVELASLATLAEPAPDYWRARSRRRWT
jgi:aryl-alcohol dehydrogenase-like predicted oxidoreductase